MTIEELSKGIEEGKWTCRELTLKCLAAIAAEDGDGRKLNSVAQISADALAEADAIDEEIRKSGRRSPLHGVPVLLKDNIDVRNMHTTASSYALHDLIADEDAAVTKRLKEAGALILGKTNLSEFAYFMSRQDMPSGYGSMNGQVVHPYVPGVDPSGSSSGSAVAVAARFVPYAIGTETDGSLMSPSIANAVVSVKPTVGLVSRNGILPISHIQDTAGPMCTSVTDAALVLQAVAGPDEHDAATKTQQIRDYVSALNTDLSGMRIGIFDTECSEQEKEVLSQVRTILREAGAEVTEVTMEKLYLDETEALMHEFRYGLDLYLSRHHSACRSLADVISFNREHAERCLVHGQDLLESSQEKSGQLSESEYIRKRIELGKDAEKGLQDVLAACGLDCLLSCGRRPKSNFAPISGSPCMTIPLRLSDTGNWQPCSCYMMADRWREDVLIHVGYAIEQSLQLKCCPDWAEEF